MKTFILIVMLVPQVIAEELSKEKINKIVSIIWIIEGKELAKSPYGVESIPLKGKTYLERKHYARKICENTVRNQFERWAAAGRKEPFFISLANRYCGPNGTVGNKNWKKNFKFYAQKEKVLF